MTGALKVAVLVCATAVVTCIGGPARAEWAVDVYGGASSTASTDLKISGRDDTAATVRAEIFDLETDTGFTLGVRGGYWFESAPYLGLGLDLFFFSIPVPSQTRSATGTLTGELLDKPITISASGQARIPSVDLPSLAFSPELRLRLPLLKSAEFPKGRLQPYLTGGPAFAFTLEGDDLAIIPGGKVGGGASFNVVPWLALFAEYRYTFFPDFEFTTDHLTYKADLNTHHVIVGVSFRF